MPGFIKLVAKKNYDKDTVKTAKTSAYYSNSEEMRKIIEYWKNLYGIKFEDYFVHVRPSLNAKQIDPNY